MTAQILVVDDEPDLEGLVLQRFRHQIKDGAMSFRQLVTTLQEGQ